MNAKQISSWVIFAGAMAFFIALPFVRPSFPIVQGEYVGELMEKRGTVTYRADQSWRVALKDGRQFWIEVAPSAAAFNGADVKVEVRCQSDAYERCSARYLAH